MKTRELIIGDDYAIGGTGRDDRWLRRMTFVGFEEPRPGVQSKLRFESRGGGVELIANAAMVRRPWSEHEKELAEEEAGRRRVEEELKEKRARRDKAITAVRDALGLNVWQLRANDPKTAVITIEALEAVAQRLTSTGETP